MISLVEFEYQPWKKIIVHDVIKVPLEFFLSTHVIGVQEGGVARPLNWVDGVLFVHVPMRPTEDVVEEQLEGKLHWASLTYTLLKDYQPGFIRPGNVRIPVVDVSNNLIFKEMVKWIKENFEKE